MLREISGESKNKAGGRGFLPASVDFSPGHWGEGDLSPVVRDRLRLGKRGGAITENEGLFI
jgi:hypothetical protein